MKYIFNVDNDNLALFMKNKGFTGNVNSYTCFFTFSAEWQNLNTFCVFTQHNKPYIVPIKDSECLFPHEVLADKGAVTIGVYGTIGAATDFKRISTNIVTVNIDVGAYNSGAIPGIPPTPEFWEILSNELKEHTDNREIHVTDEDKNIWDNKFDNPQNTSDVSPDLLYGLKKGATGKFELEEINEVPVNLSGKRYATAVVGIASAGYTSADVDVLCDDSNVAVKLNSLIEDISVAMDEGRFEGCKIVLLGGVYPILAPVDISFPNITIEGMGASTEFKRAFNSTATKATQGLIRLSADNIAVKNIKFNDDYAERSNSYNCCIFAENTFIIKNCDISDNFFTDAAKFISAQNIYYSNIINNFFECNYVNSANVVTLTNSQYNTIQNNRAEVNIGKITLQNSHNNKVTDNDCDVTLNDSEVCTLKGNIMAKCTIYFSPYATIIGNIIAEILEISTYSRNALISNNQIGHLRAYNFDYLTLSGNQFNFSDYETAIHLSTVNLSGISGNSIKNYPQAAILLEGCEYDTVSGNACIENGDAGIALLLSSYNTITGSVSAANSDSILLQNNANNNVVVGNMLDMPTTVVNSAENVIDSNSNV